MRRLGRRFRGLSPLLSTMILLSAALVAGILLYTYFSTTIASMARTPNPVIEQALYYPQLSLLYVKIRNYGSAPVPLNNAQLKIYTGNMTCTYVVTCTATTTATSLSNVAVAATLSTPALQPAGILTIEVGFASNYASISIPGCSVAFSTTLSSPGATPALCASSLGTKGGYVVFAYVYGDNLQTTQPTQITLG